MLVGCRRLECWQRQAPFRNDTKNKIVQWPDLLIKHYHEKKGHLEINRVLSEIIKRYWIVKGRGTVEILHACVPSYFWKAGVESQQMGELHPARVRKNPIHNSWDRYDRLYLNNYWTEPSKTIQLHLQLGGHPRKPFSSAFVRRKLVPTSISTLLQQSQCKFNSDNGSNFVAAEKKLSGKVAWRFSPHVLLTTVDFMRFSLNHFERYFATPYLAVPWGSLTL